MKIVSAIVATGEPRRVCKDHPILGTCTKIKLSLLVITFQLGCFGWSFAAEKSYRSTPRFFRDSHPGDLGIVLKKLGKIVKIPSGEVIEIPETGAIEFLINNRRKGEVKNYSTGYVAVSALRIFDQMTPTSPRLELFRNEKWYRGKEELSKLENLTVEPPDIDRFVSLHQPKKIPLDFTSIDDGLGGKWHAEVTPNGYASIQDAWFWTRPFMAPTLPLLLQAFSPLKSDSDHLQMRGLLIRFEEAPLGSKGPKVRFEIKPHYCKAMLVVTYSSISTEYQNYALIRLRPGDH